MWTRRRTGILLQEAEFGKNLSHTTVGMEGGGKDTGEIGMSAARKEEESISEKQGFFSQVGIGLHVRVTLLMKVYPYTHTLKNTNKYAQKDERAHTPEQNSQTASSD